MISWHCRFWNHHTCVWDTFNLTQFSFKGRKTQIQTNFINSVYSELTQRDLLHLVACQLCTYTTKMVSSFVVSSSFLCTQLNSRNQLYTIDSHSIMVLCVYKYFIFKKRKMLFQRIGSFFFFFFGLGNHWAGLLLGLCLFSLALFFTSFCFHELAGRHNRYETVHPNYQHLQKGYREGKNRWSSITGNLLLYTDSTRSLRTSCNYSLVMA